MKAQKIPRRGCALCGVAGVVALASALVITRLLPPWSPLSWQPSYPSKSDKPCRLPG